MRKFANFRRWTWYELPPDALPQTGQLPVELFYGVGGLITAAGVFLKKRK